MRYKLNNGKVFDTDKAKKTWEEDREWDGRNHISVNTGSQWDHEQLYLSKSGNWFLESWSDYQGSLPSIENISARDAAVWLSLNNEELPIELEKVKIEIME